MEITWLGHTCFRIRAKEGTVVTDPFFRKGSGSHVRLTADAVLFSDATSAAERVALVGGQPRMIAGPGEYEIKGIVITGVPTFRDAERGKKRGKNTAYVIELDDLVVGHLGDLGHVPTTEQVEQMRNIDVLLIPVGGGPTLDAVQAVEVISLLEPKVVVPMEFRTGDLDPELDPVDKFLREMGIAGAESQPKLTVSKSTLTEATQVVVLEARLG